MGGTNFTPPFPSYTSGHATFGAALFRTLANFYGRDDITFSFTSDEFNGVTKDQSGNARPVLTRTFHSFSEAAEENGQSRIYLGIHWRFDKVEGIKAGNAIADYVFANLLRPRDHHHHATATFTAAQGDQPAAAAAQATDAGLVLALSSHSPEGTVTGPSGGTAAAAKKGVTAVVAPALSQVIVLTNGTSPAAAPKRDAALNDVAFLAPDFLDSLSKPI
jgi:hypothetical protein